MFRRNKENTKPKKEKKLFFKKKKDLAEDLNNELNNTKKNNLVRIMPFRIARGFLWGLIAILCIRGTVSVFKGIKAMKLKRKIKSF